ncbi:MAG: hypothetical protein Q8P88_00845 [Candidatus Jorgensenbacteria bacterium]|nr:hypothetical protein [Candidatus Jorgensenbacteria bacterium]
MERKSFDIRGIWLNIQFFAMICFMLVGAFHVVSWAGNLGKDEPKEATFAIGPETGLGQAMPFSELSPGMYRVVTEVDPYTTALVAIVPTGDIPFLVRDVPEKLRKGGIFRRSAPTKST